MLDGGGDGVHVGIGEQLEPAAAETEALGAQADLSRTLFAADVQHAAHPRPGRRQFAAPACSCRCRIAGQQHHRARHNAAAQYLINLGDTARYPRQALRRHVRQGGGLERGRGLGFAEAAREHRGGFFDERVPGAALLALAHPTAEARGAGLADKFGSDFSHGSTHYTEQNSYRQLFGWGSGAGVSTFVDVGRRLWRNRSADRWI